MCKCSSHLDIFWWPGTSDPSEARQSNTEVNSNFNSLVQIVGQFYQVIQIAKNVDAEQTRADSQNVEVKLVIGKNTHVPEIHHGTGCCLFMYGC